MVTGGGCGPHPPATYAKKSTVSSRLSSGSIPEVGSSFQQSLVDQLNRMESFMYTMGSRVTTLESARGHTSGAKVVDPAPAVSTIPSVCPLAANSGFDPQESGAAEVEASDDDYTSSSSDVEVVDDDVHPENPPDAGGYDSDNTISGVGWRRNQVKLLGVSNCVHPFERVLLERRHFDRVEFDRV